MEPREHAVLERKSDDRIPVLDWPGEIWKRVRGLIKRPGDGREQTAGVIIRVHPRGLSLGRFAQPVSAAGLVQTEKDTEGVNSGLSVVRNGNSIRGRRALDFTAKEG